MLQRCFMMALAFTVAIPAIFVGAVAMAAGQGNLNGTWHVSARLEGCGGDRACFSADGSLILTVGGDGARAWDARTFNPVTPPLPHQLGQTERSFPRLSDDGWIPMLSADGRRVLTATYEQVRLWDARTGKQIQMFEQGRHQLTAALNADGSRVATVFESKNGDFTPSEVRIWDSATGKPLLSLWHDHLVDYVSFTHGGSRLLSIEWVNWHERIYHMWDVRNGVELFPAIHPQWDYGYNWEPGHVPAALNPDGKKLVVGAIGNRTRFTVFDAESGIEVARRATAPDEKWGDGAVQSVSFTMNGSKILDVRTVVVGLFDAVTAKPIPEQLQIDVNAWGLTADGKGMICSYRREGDDGRTEKRSHTAIWDLTTGNQLQQLDDDNISAVAFSPDGTRVAASTLDGHTTVWSITRRNGP